METNRILLRLVNQEDLPKIFLWRNKYKFRNFFHYRDNKIDYANFLIEFKKDSLMRHSQYLIELKNGGKIIGLIFSFGYKQKDGYCFINLYIDEGYETKGYGPEAFALLFCNYFNSDIVHKIYLDVFEYNTLSLSTLKSCGFVEEGIFKEHKFYQGKRYSMFRFAAYRDSVPRFQRIIEHFSKK